MLNLVIKPLNVGTISGDRSNLTYLRNFGIKQQQPAIMWYIEGAEKKILVDTGPCDPEWSQKYHWPLTRTEEQEPDKALKAIGVDPKEIELVVLSHLHWDHSFNNHLFVNAEFIVQKKELEYSIAPLPVHMKGYESVAIGMRPDYITHTKYTIIDGDKEIVPGVSLYLTPGHSPGSQCVAVETLGGIYLIAADTIPLYENWDSGPSYMPHIPNAIHVGLREYFESFEKIEKIADFILPGHEEKVFNYSQYPSLKEK